MTDPATKKPSFFKRLFLVLLLLAPIVVLWCAGDAIKPTASLCDPPPKYEKVDAPPKLATLSPEQGERTTLAFGRSTGAQRLTVRLKLVKNQIAQSGKPLRMVVREFHRGNEDDGAYMPAEAVSVRATVYRNSVLLRTCVERPDLETYSAGTYKGEVVIVDRRVTEFTLPLTVKMAFPRWPWVAILLYAVMIVGSAYVWALRTKKKDDVTFLSVESMSSWRKWAYQWGGVMSIVLGSSGAFAVFAATYLASPDWGSSPQQAITLFGAMLSAFIAAGSTPHVVDSARKPKKPRQGDGGGGGGGGGGRGDEADDKDGDVSVDKDGNQP